jgi:4-diphosphocytidyl-2-C-methyl-D-erythritol kinase
MKSAIESRNINEIAANLYNAFEDISPFEQQIKNILLENGALGAAMSGSGPAVYGIFSDKEKAAEADCALKKAGYDSFTCNPIDKNSAGRRI